MSTWETWPSLEECFFSWFWFENWISRRLVPQSNPILMTIASKRMRSMKQVTRTWDEPPNTLTKTLVFTETKKERDRFGWKVLGFRDRGRRRRRGWWRDLRWESRLEFAGCWGPARQVVSSDRSSCGGDTMREREREKQA